MTVNTSLLYVVRLANSYKLGGILFEHFGFYLYLCHR